MSRGRRCGDGGRADVDGPRAGSLLQGKVLVRNVAPWTASTGLHPDHPPLTPPNSWMQSLVDGEMAAELPAPTTAA